MFFRAADMTAIGMEVLRVSFRLEFIIDVDIPITVRIKQLVHSLVKASCGIRPEKNTYNTCELVSCVCCLRKEK